MSSTKSTVKTISNIPNDHTTTSSIASHTLPTVRINLNSLLAHAATSPIPQQRQQPHQQHPVEEEKGSNSTPHEEEED